MTSLPRPEVAQAGAQPLRGRRSLAGALEEAGLDGAPVIDADEPRGERVATTLKFTRAERAAGAESLGDQRRIRREAEEIVLAAQVIEDPEALDDDIWSLEMSPPPPWLKPQRAKLRSRWHAALVTGTAWVATLLITGLIIGGVGYGLTKFAPTQLTAFRS